MALLDFLKKKKTSGKSKSAKSAPSRPEREEAGPEKESRGFKEKNKASEKAFEVLLAPQVTEKTSLLNAQGVYVFRITESANKKEVARAIWELYGVRPRKVNVVKIPSKTRFARGHKGVRPGYKKALVFLKPGETIEIA